MALSKPKLLEILMPLLSFMALFLMAADMVHSHDTTSFAYDCFVPNPPDLIYEGGAHVPAGSEILRLTKIDGSGKPVPRSVGRVLYSRRVKFWERSPSRQATFETTIRFVITAEPDGIAAAGIAFFIEPFNTTIPMNSPLFEVEFDPYINGWDPSYPHIGININSRTSRAITRFDGVGGPIVTARIRYDPNTRMISVDATSGSQSATLGYVFDLKTALPNEVQVGISSSTGQYVSDLEKVDIYSWYFFSSLVSTSVHDESENVDANISTMRQSDN